VSETTEHMTHTTDESVKESESVRGSAHVREPVSRENTRTSSDTHLSNVTNNTPGTSHKQENKSTGKEPGQVPWNNETDDIDQ
jgi:hypothetical protein